MKRIQMLLVAFISFASAGCLSSTIANSGHRLSAYKTRNEVDACFGQPRTVVEIDGELKATYVTRKKVADSHDLWMASAYAIITLGLSEPPLIAYYSGASAYFAVVGREINFTFDKQGSVIECSPRDDRFADTRAQKRFRAKLLGEEIEEETKKNEADEKKEEAP